MPFFSIQDFRSSLQFDGARAALFDVIINPPSNLAGIMGGSALLSSQLLFKARASSLPGDSVSSVNVNYFGREIKVAGTRTFPDWSITVINDEDFAIRNAMERWMSAINSHVGNRRSIAAASNLTGSGGPGYQADGQIRQYSKTGDIIKVYNIVGLFPTDVSAIDVDWANGDTIEEFNVTFAYQWWESDTTIE